MAVNRDDSRVWAAFFDKDGTLVDDVPYNIDPAQIRLSRGAAEGLRKLHRAGFRIVIVSNQSGVARGYFQETALAQVQSRLVALLEVEAGVPLAGFYYCPHHPQGIVSEYAVQCTCRKPEPGMLLEAAEQQNIDLSQSWMVGDILDDIEAGKRAGCQTVMIDNGNETEWRTSPLREPHFTARSVNEAADIILGEITKMAGAPLFEA